MKKAKFIFKVNRNNTAKVYFNKKWQKYISKVVVFAYPNDIDVEMEQYKIVNGTFTINNSTNELEKIKTEAHFGN